MTTARQEIAPEGVEGIYHCISRCVRRAFLCGEDPYTGRSFEHRKQWVQDRLKQFAEAFAIDIFAFAVMSNHLHVVLRTRPDLVESWGDEEIAWRWLLVYPKKNRGGRSESPTEAEIAALAGDKRRVELLRGRLCSLGWFMRRLNETIARSANKEDGCKGRFWEGRFKCQVLLDETAVLTCMAYVDLNPIRSGLAVSPETSLHTSAQVRITARQARLRLDMASAGAVAGRKPFPSQLVELEEEKAKSDWWLFPLSHESPGADNGSLEFSLDEYLSLVDWTGRQMKRDLPGKIPEDLKPILARLKFENENWIGAVRTYGRMFFRAAGRVESLRRAASSAGRCWYQGVGRGRLLFS
ncbi:MAG: transposase [Pseudomonadota bacterium]